MTEPNQKPLFASFSSVLRKVSSFFYPKGSLPVSPTADPTKILVIAHRGLSSRFPENTIRAFQEAIKAGANGFECDLRMTKDRKVVAFHDDTLTRLCGVRGTIESKNWDDLKDLLVMKQEPIATLDQICSQFRDTAINFEVKKSPYAKQVVVELYHRLKQFRHTGKVFLSSFDKDVLVFVKELDQEGIFNGLGELFPTRTWKGPFDRFKLSQAFQYYSANIPSKFLVRLSKDENALRKYPPLWLWTLNTPDQWRAALESRAPVEAIITDYPDLLRVFLDNIKKEREDQGSWSQSVE